MNINIIISFYGYYYEYYNRFAHKVRMYSLESGRSTIVQNDEIR